MARVQRSILRLALIAGVVLALDEGTKTAARILLSTCTRPPATACDHVSLVGHPIQVLLLRVENAGSALGAAQGLWIWTLLAGLGLGLAAMLWTRSTYSRGLAIAVGLLLGGTAGNLIDRVVFGHVTDVLGFGWGPGAGISLNMADLALAIGAVMGTWSLYRALFSRPQPSCDLITS